MAEKAAILLDGGFVKKRLYDRVHHFPTVSEVVDLCSQVMAHDRLKDKEMLRAFFYDAPPFDGIRRNPISGAKTDFSSTAEAQRNLALLEGLELQPDFAVRRGVVAHRGWKLGRWAIKSLQAKPRPLKEGDLVPDFEQKGVDLRIGLDIASIALKGVVGIIVLISGDSDLVPAVKFARKEGLKVYLEPMGGPIRRELRAHSDFVF